MDLGRAENNVRIQKVLKTFQSTAMDSLRGPSSFSASWDKLSPSELEGYKRYLQQSDMIKREPVATQAQQRHPQQGPIFIPMDTSSEKSETELEGNRIACFMVGGEKRLCLPQVLQTVLRGFHMNHVQDVCTDLHINFSRCNPKQLEFLKANGDLPENAPSCGLITKTDSERLVSNLLHSHADEYSDPLTPNSFKIYHECFGKSKGVIIPELYTTPDARCIRCADCFGLFNPEKFVAHTHKALENRTCHWGFDPANWRCYIHLAKDQDHKESLQVFLEDLKSRFSRSYKRKEFGTSDKGPDSKRARYYELSSTAGSSTASTSFRPWSPNSKLLSSILSEGKQRVDKEAEDSGDLPPYLHKGPPKLLNPERVIPFDDQKQYERHFAPNVSLAPIHPKKRKCKEYQAALALAEAAEQQEKQPERRDSVSSHPNYNDETDSVSTKSDASTVLSPLSSRRPSQPDEVHPWRQQEVELFKQALEIEPSDTEASERVMHSFLRACKLADDSVTGLASAARDMHMNVLAANQREGEYRGQIAALQSAADTTAAKHREQQHQITEKYRSQLQAREAQYSEMHTEMLREVHRLRDELRKHGKNVPDIAYDFELMGDCPSIASPPESPKTEPAHGVKRKAEFLVKVKEEQV